jgi:hypothetical protein
VEVVLGLAVLAVLLLPGDVLRFGAAPPPEPGAAATPLVVDDLDDQAGGLFDREFIQWRLDVLADELARIDVDPGVMARGFRTTVARSAYEALLADAAALPRPSYAAAGAGEIEFEML